MHRKAQKNGNRTTEEFSLVRVVSKDGKVYDLLCGIVKQSSRAPISPDNILNSVRAVIPTYPGNFNIPVWRNSGVMVDEEGISLVALVEMK